MPAVQQQRWSTSIQAAIDEAADGEEIVIAPGTYYEQIDFLGKAIMLRSIEPNNWAIVAATIIDANDLVDGIGVTFAAAEGVDSVLSGLTVRGGKSGLLITGAGTSPRIEGRPPGSRDASLKVILPAGSRVTVPLRLSRDVYFAIRIPMVIRRASLA
jgi:polygalacturonase